MDRCDLLLGPEAHDSLLALLDAPRAPNTALVELMGRKAPWED